MCACRTCYSSDSGIYCSSNNFVDFWLWTMNFFVKHHVQQKKVGTYSTVKYRKYWSTLQWIPISNWHTLRISILKLLPSGVQYEESNFGSSI
jgi:hypothetical protein